MDGEYVGLHAGLDTCAALRPAVELERLVPRLWRSYAELVNVSVAVRDAFVLEGVYAGERGVVYVGVISM